METRFEALTNRLKIHQQRTVLLLLTAICLERGVSERLKCILGYDVRFSSPCPEEFDSFTFSKHPQNYIVRNGLLTVQDRFEIDESRTRVTLTDCQEQDFGEYFWMCSKANLTKHFILDKVNRPVKNENITCKIGGQVSFKCPCCPEEFANCRFKKLFSNGFILNDGIINEIHSRYAMDANNSFIILKECTERDSGTHVWMCGKCNINKQFELNVVTNGNGIPLNTSEEPFKDISRSTGLSSPLVLIIILYFIQYFKG